MCVGGSTSDGRVSVTDILYFPTVETTLSRQDKVELVMRFTYLALTLQGL